MREGKPLSKATALQTLNAIRAFILWLADQPGYRSRIRYSDAAYFRLSEKDTRIAKAPLGRPVPSPEQIECVLLAMPAHTDIEQRNRALIAFTWLTGVRDGALASLKVKHVNLTEGRVNQDPREVKTKNSKPQITTFFPVAGEARRIVTEWVELLTKDRLWGLDDPLFPATLVEHGTDRQFKPADWPAGTGAMRTPSARSSRKHLKPPDCRASIRTASATHSPCLASGPAARRKSSRRGARI